MAKRSPPACPVFCLISLILNLCFLLLCPQDVGSSASQTSSAFVNLFQKFSAAAMAPVVILTPTTSITSPDLHTHDLDTFLQDSYLVLYLMPYCEMFLFLQYLSPQEMSQKSKSFKALQITSAPLKGPKFSCRFTRLMDTLATFCFTNTRTALALLPHLSPTNQVSQVSTEFTQNNVFFFFFPAVKLLATAFFDNTVGCSSSPWASS